VIYIWTESRRALHASFVTSPVWAKGNGHQHRRVASLIMHGRLARHFHFLFFFFSELLAIARATFVLQESTATMRRSIPWAVLVARAAVRRRRRRPVGAYRTHAHRFFFVCVGGGLFADGHHGVLLRESAGDGLRGKTKEVTQVIASVTWT